MNVPLSPGLVLEHFPAGPRYRSLVLTTDDLGAILVKGRPCTCPVPAGGLGHRWPSTALACAQRRVTAFEAAAQVVARVEARAAGLTYPPAEAARLEAEGGDR